MYKTLDDTSVAEKIAEINLYTYFSSLFYFIYLFFFFFHNEISRPLTD